ncbi:thiamine pyrophosphate-dependent enzyme [Candidatus Latescibacterota bacterium]
MEAVTYRWRGHVGPREDMDVGLKRNEDLSIWRQRDPVGRLVASLKDEGLLSDAAHEDIVRSVDVEVKAACKEAEAAPYPDVAALTDLVYSGGTVG